MQLNYKLYSWHAVIAVLSWQFWRYIDQLFNSPTPSFELVGIVHFIVLSAVIAVGLMLFKNKWHALSFGGFHGLFYIFYFGFAPLNLLGVAILIGFVFMSRAYINSELDERTKINSRVILRWGMLGIVIGVFVLVSFAAYQSPLAEQIEDAETLPPETELFILGIVENTLGRQFEAATETEKQSILSQITGEIFREINLLLGPYFQYAPPLLAFGLFLLLWGLSWIFVWLSVLIGMGIFWILKKTGFLKIEEKDVKAEVLVI